MEDLKLLIFILFRCIALYSCAQVETDVNMPELGKMNFTQIVTKYGYANVEEFNVTTDDGYILGVFHLPGDSSKPVLLIHGMLDSSDSFVLRGNGSLAIHLASEGYDVWTLNTRGNKYSAGHVDPQVSAEVYWDYSFQELGYYDVPAAIDLVLNATGQESLFIVGHSQGTEIMFVLGATRPEYNTKVRTFVALAPICYLNHNPFPDNVVLDLTPVFDFATGVLQVEDFFSAESPMVDVRETYCTSTDVTMETCILGPFLASGYDPEELMPKEFERSIWGHYPQPISRKNMVHVNQVATRHQFAQYDYGVKENVLKYNSTEPPLYDLSLVTMKIAMMVGRNDKLADIPDVEHLRSELPDVVDFHIMERKQFNHFDFMWGLHMPQYLFPIIDYYFEQYTNSTH